MPRKRRTSPKLDIAMARIAGLKTIDESLDLGNGVMLAEYETHFKAVQTDLIAYNELLASIDALSVEIKHKETILGAYSERVLMGVTLRYGRGSSEYLRAGGKLRKAPSKRSTSPAATANATHSPTSNASISALMGGDSSAIEVTNGNSMMAAMN